MANIRIATPDDDPNAEDPADYLVNEEEACAIIGGRKTPIHRSTLWRGIDSGRYPPPVKVGPNINRWDKRKLAKVVDSAASARPQTSEKLIPPVNILEQVVTANKIINRPRAAPMSERGLDLYESPEVATRRLLDAEPALGSMSVLEPCCGKNAIARVLRKAGISVYASDIVDYGTEGQDRCVDFFSMVELPADHINAIVSNPPYGRNMAAHFVRHALTLVPDVYALLPLTFLESAGREDILCAGSGFRRVLVFSDRLPRMHRDTWTGNRATATQAFAWMCWRRSFAAPATIERICAKIGSPP